MKKNVILLKVLIAVGIGIMSYVIVLTSGLIIKNSAPAVENPEKSEIASTASDSSEKKAVIINHPSENSGKKEESVTERSSEKKEESEISVSDEKSEDQDDPENSPEPENNESSEPEITEESSAEDSEDISSSGSEQEISDNESDASVSNESDASESEDSQQGSAPSSEDETELISLLSTAEMTKDDLNAKNCRQLVTVNSSGSTASISFYYLDENNVWNKQQELSTEGYIGREGVTKTPREGFSGTPFGLHPVGKAFYIDNVPETSLDSFQITDDTYWVDDPESQYYNQLVTGTENKDWNSAEHMIDSYQCYHYGFVIEYNTVNIVPYNGSAFFFHVTNSTPTAGCVATSEKMVLDYLRKLDASLNPYILII